MDVRTQKPGKKTGHVRGRPPFECIVLLLQGGGALGAYQGGVYQALAEGGIHPNWIAGISVGAINAAIIAGNAPEERVKKLRTFWEQITAPPVPGWGDNLGPARLKGDAARDFANQLSAIYTLLAGAPGFFTPRIPMPFFSPTGSSGATSYYDTAPLKATLEQLVDFDRLNGGGTRCSVGAVNVRSGNFIYFDTASCRIGPKHIMASGALPPGFPAVEIDGQHYWDGALISNTPLNWVVDTLPRRDTLAFQVDLWSARGELPGNMTEVLTREKEIQYSSRTRAGTNAFKEGQRLRNATADLLAKLPKRLKDTPEAKLLSSVCQKTVYRIVHLIYRARRYEGQAKDYEFSRLSMEDHWQAGYHDTLRTLHTPEALERPDNEEGVAVFDIAEHGHD
jgi:NTE family protein